MRKWEEVQVVLFAQGESSILMRVFVRNIEFLGRHGVYEQERRDGRRFQVDLEVVVDERDATCSDALEDTLDYRELAQVVSEVAHGPSRLLVEKLAGEICEAMLERYESVREVVVEVRKYAPDVVGNPQWVGVRLSRQRDETEEEGQR